MEFKKYFWDVDWDDLIENFSQYHPFIISRLLDKGDIPEVRWVKKHFDLTEIFQVMKISKIISEKTRQFWLNYEQIVSKCS